MRRRETLRLGAGLLTGTVVTTAGCAEYTTQPTAPVKLNNETTSEVFFRVSTETADGEFWREIEVSLPDNGVKNDPWFKEMFVDEGDYLVTVQADSMTAEREVRHPSSEWDYLSISVTQSGITMRRRTQ